MSFMTVKFYGGTFVPINKWFKILVCYILLPPVLSHLVYESVVGGTSEIACNFSPLHEDKVSLILWYKDNATKPIYILDARNGIRNKPTHLPSGTLTSRSFYNVSIFPSILQVWDIKEDDHGTYKCRVDYKHEPTEYFFVFLDVIVPPRETIIMDKYGQRLKDLIGPYNEGTSLLLICEADGGKPPPGLTWWKGDNLLQANYTITPQGFPRNELMLQQLCREDLLSSLTCKASNTNLTVPTSSSVIVDLYLKPLDVRITTINRPLIANRPAELVCETWGARPSAHVTWWIGTKRLIAVTDTISADGNHTVSTVSFIPKVKDNVKNITCRADNLLLQESAITDVWNLLVYYTPQVGISILSQHNGNGVVEGSEVRLECLVDASPLEVDVWWRFNESTLTPDLKSGVTLDNQSLLIKNVQRDHVGKYQCMATNQEGEGRSEEKLLVVQYPPVCKESKIKIIAVSPGSEVKVLCEVEAEPKKIEFHWVFNNTLGVTSVKAATSNWTTSVTTVSLMDHTNFGTLFCWAENLVGRQKIPCRYKIVPGGLPKAPNDCVVINKTKESFSVRCLPGFDGGLSQQFQVEVFTERKERLVANISAPDVPFFFISSLPSGTQFILVMYAVNALGTSPSVSLQASTLVGQSESKTKASMMRMIQLPHILGIVFGVSLVLIIIIIAKVLLKYLRSRRHERRGIKGEEKTEKPVHSLEEEESPKHDAQLLDLISTKHDFSGPPDVTHISANWGHALTVEFHPRDFSEEVILRMDRKPMFIPSQTVRWSEGESGNGDREAGEGRPSTFVVIENLECIPEREKWAPNPIEVTSLQRIEEDDSGITAETPLMSGLLEAEEISQQSVKEVHILSTAV
ncbi:protein turtle-like [Tachypleus tridentatus]|uniref:protein turtle-like n=1 Tax=Tachypleus tridentatus TaxID=6853 RepID=UPI003FD3A498